ncbi:MAG: restriction endonuclease subunit S [Humidesulfovibrio sp.]|uniref:restriction endonuclease subunit S n=1 Tax=Humidesulfovibrio sp. TaxID=2910988 RepID=UPI0027F625C8|nr:restriction endonuclease subunit S [Humidesulfovibrio sp.]MDQ7835590.1 restriction endonuclease subunit S [Humidesulfovibrio sp.]
MSTRPLKPGWKMVKFGEVVKNANLAERDPEANGIERIVGLEHIDSENLHIRRWNSVADGTSFSRKFVPGQTLFGKRRAYQRKVAYAKFEGICSGDILTFEPKNSKVLLPELLPFICQSDAFFDHALGTSAGSLSPRTSWAALQDFAFPLPPLDEQKRIAEILWAIDESAMSWSNSLCAMSGLMQATIDSFVYGSDGKTSQWPQVKLSDHVEESLYGPRFPAGLYSPEGNAYTIRTTDFDRVGGIEYADVPAANLEESVVNRHLLQDGDFLLSRSGEYAGLGAVFRAQEDGRIYIPAAFLIRFRLRGSLLPDYLMALFRSKFHRLHVLPLAKGSAQPNISGSRALDLLIPTPPIKKQEQLLRYIAEIRNRQEELKSHWHMVSTTTKGLIDFYVTGAAHV